MVTADSEELAMGSRQSAAKFREDGSGRGHGVPGMQDIAGEDHNRRIMGLDRGDNLFFQRTKRGEVRIRDLGNREALKLRRQLRDRHLHFMDIQGVGIPPHPRSCGLISLANKVEEARL
jgi:hypothetical protein